jgi:hypothetical protein
MNEIIHARGQIYAKWYTIEQLTKLFHENRDDKVERQVINTALHIHYGDYGVQMKLEF